MLAQPGVADHLRAVERDERALGARRLVPQPGLEPVGDLARQRQVAVALDRDRPRRPQQLLAAARERDQLDPARGLRSCLGADHPHLPELIVGLGEAI